MMSNGQSWSITPISTDIKPRSEYEKWPMVETSSGSVSSRMRSVQGSRGGGSRRGSVARMSVGHEQSVHRGPAGPVAIIGPSAAPSQATPSKLSKVPSRLGMAPDGQRASVPIEALTDALSLIKSNEGSAYTVGLLDIYTAKTQGDFFKGNGHGVDSEPFGRAVKFDHPDVPPAHSSPMTLGLGSRAAQTHCGSRTHLANAAAVAHPQAIAFSTDGSGVVQHSRFRPVDAATPPSGPLPHKPSDPSLSITGIDVVSVVHTKPVSASKQRKSSLSRLFSACFGRGSVVDTSH